MIKTLRRSKDLGSNNVTYELFYLGLPTDGYWEKSHIELMLNSPYVYPVGKYHSISSFYVPEERRGKTDDAKRLINHVMSIYGKHPLSSQVSSKPSLVLFYKNGFRSSINPTANLEESLDMLVDNGYSLNMRNIFPDKLGSSNIPSFDIHKIQKLAREREDSKGNSRFRFQNLQHTSYLLNAKNWDSFSPELITESTKDIDLGDMTTVHHAKIYFPVLLDALFATIKNENSQGTILKKLRDEDFIRKEILHLLNSKGVKHIDADGIKRLYFHENNYIGVDDSEYNIRKNDPIYRSLINSPKIYPFRFSLIFEKLEVPTKYIVKGPSTHNGYTTFRLPIPNPEKERHLLVSDRSNGLILYFADTRYPIRIEGYTRKLF